MYVRRKQLETSSLGRHPNPRVGVRPSCYTPILHLTGRFLVQPAEIRLPPDGNNPDKQAAELRRHVDEVDRLDDGPDLEAVLQAVGEGVFQSLHGIAERAPAEQRVHAEEVRVEDGREGALLEADLGHDRERLGREIEVVVEVHKPDRKVSIHSKSYTTLCILYT